MNTATFDIFRFADFSYNTRAATSATEHARAIDFFVMLAYAVPKYRAYLLAPNGVHLLVQNIKSLVAANPPIPMLDLCGGLANVSQYSWCVYSVALDVCPALVNLLMYVLVTTFLCGYRLIVSSALARTTVVWVVRWKGSGAVSSLFSSSETLL